MRVVPVRFTDDVPGMRRFLEALGLEADISSDSGAWVALYGAVGGVGLHAAAAAESPRTSGETSLSFESDEPLEDVAARLRAAGFEADVVDESYGRTLLTVDPDGEHIAVNAVMTDLHGYSRER